MNRQDAASFSLNEYQELAKRPLNWKSEWEVERPGTNGYTLCNMGLGLAGEAGEVVDLLKKHLFHGHPISKESLAEELGDVLFYIAAIGTILGIPLSQVADENLTKLEKRYPNGFTQEMSINRK